MNEKVRSDLSVERSIYNNSVYFMPGNWDSRRPIFQDFVWTSQKDVVGELRHGARLRPGIKLRDGFDAVQSCFHMYFVGGTNPRRLQGLGPLHSQTKEFLYAFEAAGGFETISGGILAGLVETAFGFGRCREKRLSVALDGRIIAFELGRGDHVRDHDKNTVEGLADFLVQGDIDDVRKAVADIAAGLSQGYHEHSQRHCCKVDILGAVKLPIGQSIDGAGNLRAKALWLNYDEYAAGFTDGALRYEVVEWARYALDLPSRLSFSKELSAAVADMPSLAAGELTPNALRFGITLIRGGALGLHWR